MFFNSAIFAQNPIFMIRFLENYSLKKHNSFGIDARAKYFFEFTDPVDLHIFLTENRSWQEDKLLVLGEGSNILFLDDFDGLVLHPKIPGIKTVNEDRNHYWIEVGAGENWDELVDFAVNYDFGGIENLSFIPGKVGAAPVQNIGAYGQEVGNVVEKVIGYDMEKLVPVEYSAEECAFSYRNSIFKQQLKGKFVITSVVFRLEKFPEFNLNYGQLEENVKAKGEVSLENVRRAVIEIRKAKLPAVEEIGNAGSFFKNPVVDAAFAEHLKAKHADLPLYPAPEGKKKLAAGWLIEQAGWKGARDGAVGVHKNQALILVNHGTASGREVFDFSEKIKASVFDRFGVQLQREVNCI